MTGVRSTGLLLALAVGCAAEPAAAPNLLLVTIDTLRADRLACYGGPEDVGVEICRLGRGGTRFAWAFAAAAYTVPSVASLLTSRYPSSHGVAQGAGSRLPDRHPTLAERLRAAGYATGAVVSNAVLGRFRNFRRGFESYDAELTEREGVRPVLERRAVATTDAALAWVRAQGDRRWFLWVHYQDPHGPYDPPGVPAVPDAAGAARLPVLDVQSGLRGIPAYQALPGLFSAAAYEARYLDEVRHVDAHLGRLLAGLDAADARPAVLFTSDHGEAFGEDGFHFAHGHSVGLDQIRVPLLYRPPRAGASRVVQQAVSLVDVAPTLLALAGVDAPPGFEGRPLPLQGEPGGSERALFAEHRQRIAVIAAGTYYSRDRDPSRAPEWYPPRLARLDGDGPLPPVSHPTPVDAPRDLERSLATFARRRRAERAETVPVSPETLERMRELGYVDP